MTSHTVTSSDGVRLFVRETGNPQGRPILLIHGWSQHHLCWSKQLNSNLGNSFRLIAPDLRGHGASDKPEDSDAYNHSKPWADDIHSIIEQLELVDPLLVGWSMGGWVIFDYLRVYGDANVAGIVTIGSTVVMNAEVAGRRHRDVQAKGMFSEDQHEALEATIKFVKACVSSPLSKHDLAMMVGFNMLCPPKVRADCRLRVEDYRDTANDVTKPFMIVQGEAERVCVTSMFEEICDALPNANIKKYPGCGHAPFWENPDKFNNDLASFCQSTLEIAA